MRAALLIALLLFFSGCWSTTSLMTEPRPYGGVRAWATTFNHFDHAGNIIAVLTVPDVPLSFLLDTLTLPFTIPSTPEELYGSWPSPRDIDH